jgi:hypothetical protein
MSDQDTDATAMASLQDTVRAKTGIADASTSKRGNILGL